MSLHQLAQTLAAHGRGGDTMLAHINPQEAGILKLLGGSGTINPHTGLREFKIGIPFIDNAWRDTKNSAEDAWRDTKHSVADILKDLGPYAPLVLGAALGPAGFGVFGTALGTGLAVGATYAVANESLASGLKAGLGAYGGANMWQQVSKLGANAPVSAGSNYAPSVEGGAPSSGAQFDISNPGAGGSWSPGTSAPNAVQTVTPPPADVLTSATPSYTEALRNTYNQVADAASNAYDKVANTNFGKGVGQIMEDPYGSFANAKVGYADAAALALPEMENAANDAEEENRRQEEAARQKFEASQIGDIHDFEYDPETMSYVPKGTRQVKYASGELYNQTYDPDTGTYTRTAANGGVVALGAGRGVRPAGYVEPTVALGAARGMRLGYVEPTVALGAARGMNLPTAAEDAKALSFKDLIAKKAAEDAKAAVEAELKARTANVVDYSYDPESQQFTRVGEQQIVPTTPVDGPATPRFTYDPTNQSYTPVAANGGIMSLNMGGVSDLGSYSDGGRMLRGPGDGVSDSIPAMIGGKQPARLADGEFVIPARIVSELGNGSSEAGARKLYAMMDRIQKARGKTTGKHAVATNSRAEKHLPA